MNTQTDFNMQSFDKVEELIPRAEIFRSKLIEDFQLLNSFTTVSSETPKYYSNELSDSPDILTKMLKETPHALNLMLVLILSNSVVLGIQAEVSQLNNSSIQWLKLSLDIFDYLSMLAFIMEILLKWVDEFWGFWRNGWNIFDFLVTVMSLLPELIQLASGKNTTEGLAVVAENLRVFRILRSLKMVSRFAQLRIIVLTILKAFKSMVFILTLLGVFMYIFAVAGTVMFSQQKKPQSERKHKDSFSTLGQSLATLFQLFTLDHWLNVLQNLTEVSNELTAKIYVILWICIGAFIFRNIFAGIMVMNFQNIRADFAVQYSEREMEMEDETNGQMLKAELAVQHERSSITDPNRLFTPMTSGRRLLKRSFPTSTEHSTKETDLQVAGTSSQVTASVGETEPPQSPPQPPEAPPLPPFLNTSVPVINVEHINSFNKSEFPESATWNNTVRLNLNNLANTNNETLWPRGTLFRYYQLMEALQDNLAERQQLQRLLALAISNLHDKKN